MAWDIQIRRLELQQLERDMDEFLEGSKYMAQRHDLYQEETHFGEEMSLEDLNDKINDAMGKVVIERETSSFFEDEDPAFYSTGAPVRLQKKDKINRKEIIEKICQEISAANGAQQGSNKSIGLRNKRSQYDFVECDKIGKGSFGTVYRAMIFSSEKASEQMAVKKIDITREDDWRRSWQKAKREVQILSELDNPNIVKFLDAYFDEGVVFILMDLCDGSIRDSLDNFFRPKKVKAQFKERVIKKYAYQICQAIEYIHSKEIIHTDIRCDNIGVDKNGSIRLFDFGLARILNDKTPNIDIDRNMFWLPPEMMMGHEYGLNVDCWSLGATVYEMDCGRPPFDTSMSKVQMRALAIGGNLSPPSLPKGYSPEAIDFVRVCMTVDSSNRPSAKELLTHRFFSSLKQSNSK